MDDVWFILASLFSLVGFAALAYGRRQRRAAPTLVGAALMGYPYFVSSPVALVAIGVLLLGGLVIGSRLEDDL